jgi:hypothetical protein
MSKKETEQPKKKQKAGSNEDNGGVLLWTVIGNYSLPIDHDFFGIPHSKQLSKPSFTILNGCMFSLC